MPVPPCRPKTPPPLRRPLERLDRLPLRPTSARQILSTLTDESSEPADDRLASPKIQALREIDPGWVLAESRPGPAADPLELVEALPWWPSPSGPAREALQRLWRQSVAVAQAARRLAREAEVADVERIARAGLLHALGLWAVAAIDADWLADWLAEPDPRRRREREIEGLGTEATRLGRTLAERWGCDPLVADAAWLHADLDGVANGAAADPAGLALVQRAFAMAERTPWALYAADPRDLAGSDPALRLLVAEVQVRCGPAFLEPDATPHEERLSRSNARLRRQVAHLLAHKAAADGLLGALAQSDPAEAPERWAERAARSWCEAPGVATARVVWTGPEAEPAPAEPGRAGRPATRVLSLADRGRPCAEVHLWGEPDVDSIAPEVLASGPAWRAWAALVAERTRLDARLEALHRSLRLRVEQEEPRLRRAKLDALAEFAAGAGHELNNPLAVIVGRAQLLLARATDPDAVRSLRAILAQAQRAHRILRDLMFVARPAEPRPRFCQVDEIVRASLRDFRLEAESRGVRLVVEGGEPGPKVWIDPDWLRHLADAMLRNALESTPRGGTVQVALAVDPRSLRWSVKDNGRGMTAAESEHVLDPFYCGRQAGRGLGLGLPRVARIVHQAGGELRWQSSPGQGSVFRVHLPLTSPPRPPAETQEPGPPASRSDPALPKP